MKSKALLCAIAVASLGFGSLSYAQDHGRQGHDRQGYQQRGHEQRADQHRGDRREARQERREDRREARSDLREARRDLRDARGHYQIQSRDDRRFDGRHDRHYGARGHQFHRGGHIPQQYRHHQYVVNDWHARQLSRPPYGHHWVQVDGDYVLIAVATGLIANLLLSQ